jgi:hypothetical protein
MLPELAQRGSRSVDPAADLLLLQGVRGRTWISRSLAGATPGQRAVQAVELKVKCRGALYVARGSRWRDDRPPVGRMPFDGEFAAMSDARRLFTAIVKNGHLASIEANLDVLTAGGDHFAEQRHLLAQRAPFLGLPRAARRSRYAAFVTCPDLMHRVHTRIHALRPSTIA